MFLKVFDPKVLLDTCCFVCVYWWLSSKETLTDIVGSLEREGQGSEEGSVGPFQVDFSGEVIEVMQ